MSGEVEDMNDIELVNELAKVDDGLTEWEVDFVESIARQVLDQKKELSRRPGGQRDTAERLYRKHVLEE